MTISARSGMQARTWCVSAALVLCLAGCAVHWPWHHRAPPAPVAVSELMIAPANAATAGASLGVTQFWDRNTLLIDLTSLSGEGGALITRSAGHSWPVRLEFRVRPGSMARLELSGAQREVFVVPASGEALLLKVPPGVYARDTEQLSLNWSAADGSAH